MSLNDTRERKYRGTVRIFASPPQMWKGHNYAHAVARRLRLAGYEVILDETSPQMRGVRYCRNPSLSERHRIMGILLDEFEAGIHVVNTPLFAGENFIYISHEGNCPGGKHRNTNPFSD